MPAVLIVCEGNVCRSPYVERVLGARLHRAGVHDVLVTSAGTHARPGEPMVTRSALAVEAAGGAAADFASSPLDPGRLRAADLVLTLERVHRADVLDVAPALLRRTFTIREFHRLAAPVVARTPSVGDDDAGRRSPSLWRAVPEVLGAQRTITSNADDDTADPVQGDAEAYDAFIDRVAQPIDTVVRFAVLAQRLAAGSDRA